MRYITFVFILAAASLTGCTNYLYYAPNQVNVPLLKDKKDARISAGYSPGPSVLAADVQLAYALAPHVGVIASASGARSVEEFEIQQKDSDEASSRMRMLEVGAGYFTAFTKKDKLILEIYGGAGLGDSRQFYTYWNSTSQSDTKGRNTFGLRKVFLQPSLGFIPNRSFELAFGSRISGIFFSLRDAGYSNQNDSFEYGEMLQIDAKKLFILMEPSLKLSVGRKVRFWISVDGPFPIGRKVSNLTDTSYPNFRFGILFKLNGQKDNS